MNSWIYPSGPASCTKAVGFLGDSGVSEGEKLSARRNFPTPGAERSGVERQEDETTRSQG